MSEGRGREGRRGGTGRRGKRQASEVWHELARLAGGRLLDDSKKPGDKVAVDHGGFLVWAGTEMVSTGTTVVIVTRVRSYYPGFRELEVRVRPRTVFDRLLAAFGARRPPPLPPRLVERYVVRGDPSSRVPSLFTAGLAEAVLAAPTHRLTVGEPSRKERKRLGEGWGEVSCRRSGTEQDPVRFLALIEVVRRTLDGLTRIGEARDPEG